MRIFRNSAYASLLNADRSDPGIQKLYVRSVGYCGADKNFREKPRYITYGGYYWCASGGAKFSYGGKKYTLNPGEIWFYPPGSVVDFYLKDEGMLFYWMALYGEALMPLMDALDIAPGKKFCGPPPDELFQELIAAVRYATPDRRIDVLSIAMKILFQMASPDVSCPGGRSGSLAQDAKQIIEKECFSQNFFIGRLPNRLGVHAVTLCREFKKEFQITPSDFLIGCRLRKAMELLESRQYLVKEVADMCGFSSPEYFATVFTAKFGCPPSKFLYSATEK